MDTKGTAWCGLSTLGVEQDSFADKHALSPTLDFDLYPLSTAEHCALLREGEELYTQALNVALLLLHRRTFVAVFRSGHWEPTNGLGPWSICRRR